MKIRFPNFRQHDTMDCGPTCLQMIASFYGRYYSIESLREKSHITREGVSLMGIADAAESIGFRSLGVQVTFEQLVQQIKLPTICHWQQQHFIVVYKIKKIKGKITVFVSDPVSGLLKFTKDEFIKGWGATDRNKKTVGIALIIEPTQEFYKHKGDEKKAKGFAFLMEYLKPHKKFITQLILGLLLGSLLQLILPFLTQAVVDIGINTQNIDFIYIVLIAQLILFISRMSVEFIRSWILLHISTRINISLISDFLIKLMKLPIRFFDTKMTGDLIQRIEDHSRIEHFLTGQTLSVLFSMFNLILFGIVMAYYSTKIFIIFLLGSVLYVTWVNLFMRRRREIDNKRFAQMSMDQSNLIQLITGMQEIKLNNCEKLKRWEWESIQTRLFRVKIQSLKLSQFQQLGGLFFNESKNIIITITAALSVVKGDMSLGMMLSVQYILGQLNSPIDQMISFIHSAQDAKISLERLNEIHSKEEEEQEIERLKQLPSKKDLTVENITFQYEGSHSSKVLNNVSFPIPAKKVTAIVGTSGSGKTTLIKLLLGFYQPIVGDVKIGGNNLTNFNHSWWRSQCGVVMQDGYIFSDTIVKNIAIADEHVNRERLLYAIKVANIQEYIDRLPLGFNTKIGQEGIGLSQGQKQRILIARAVYKNPEYLFLDEATNALDANNEKIILENLNHFFEGKTVIVVAHRLSTVKNADQIIVLDDGRIVERGSHYELIEELGTYYNLVRNQLELGQ
ncbi:MAG: peptidase domain-containing ABC transporter [Nitrososphaeraceae archaeon]